MPSPLSACPHSPPLPFITTQLEKLGPGASRLRFLDVACGRGRHLCAASRMGLQVSGVDVDADAIAAARSHLSSAALSVFDVECDASLPTNLGQFEVVSTTFFLFRPLLPALVSRLAPGGAWWLETFHEQNRRRHGRPRREAFALKSGEAEALARAHGLSIAFVDEGDHGGTWTTQLVARKR